MLLELSELFLLEKGDVARGDFFGIFRIILL
jgi:hypothetical protein